MGKPTRCLVSREDFLDKARHPKDNKNSVSIDIPETLDWLAWRLITKRIATMYEIRHTYDLSELYSAHLALDIQAEIEFLQAEKLDTPK